MSKEAAIAKAMLCKESVPKDILDYAERWYGPQCVRIEVTGTSAFEYNDEYTTDHSDDYCVRGFAQDGSELYELFLPYEDAEEGFWLREDEYLEDNSILPVEPLTESEVYEKFTDPQYIPAFEYYMIDKTSLPNGYFYWGNPDENPYEEFIILKKKLLAAVDQSRPGGKIYGK